MSGTTIPVSASGGATLLVDAYGETLTGEAEAVISLYGYDMSLDFVFEGENDDGDIEGIAGLALGSWYTIELDMTGSLTEDGQMQLAFEAAVDIYIALELDGSVNATRVSRSTEISSFL
jgi:hypothetical protein